MGLFLCDALRLKWQMSRVRVNLRAEQKDLRFCYDMLSCVSRSFAVVIMKLTDASLRDGICVFYLVLRALDTLEDDMDVPVELKLRELPKFHVHLTDPHWCMHGVGSDKERELLEQFPRLSSEYRKLPQAFQDIIADVCERMANGMCDFLQRPVVSKADYDLYCHYVAGLVGHGLTRLFACCTFENSLVARDLTTANHMGLFLQKTNIIRDYYEDIVQEPPRAFWPREIWGQYVHTLAELRTIALSSCSSSSSTSLPSSQPNDNNNKKNTPNTNEESDTVNDVQRGVKDLEAMSTKSVPLSYSEEDEHAKEKDDDEESTNDAATQQADDSLHVVQHILGNADGNMDSNGNTVDAGKGAERSGAISAPASPTIRQPEQSSLTRARHCINAMVCDAVQHLPHVIDYLSALQDPSVLTFCAIPQVMAIATLTEVYNNPQTYVVKIKVSRPETCRIMLHCNSLCPALDMIAGYCNALYGRLDWSDDGSTSRLREALFATTTKIDAYRELRAPVPYTRSLLTRYPALGGKLILRIADSVAGFLGVGLDSATSTSLCGAKTMYAKEG